MSRNIELNIGGLGRSEEGFDYLGKFEEAMEGLSIKGQVVNRLRYGVWPGGKWGFSYEEVAEVFDTGVDEVEQVVSDVSQVMVVDGAVDRVVDFQGIPEEKTEVLMYCLAQGVPVIWVNTYREIEEVLGLKQGTVRGMLAYPRSKVFGWNEIVDEVRQVGMSVSRSEQRFKRLMALRKHQQKRFTLCKPNGWIADEADEEWNLT